MHFAALLFFLADASQPYGYLDELRKLGFEYLAV